MKCIIFYIQLQKHTILLWNISEIYNYNTLHDVAKNHSIQWFWTKKCAYSSICLKATLQCGSSYANSQVTTGKVNMLRVQLALSIVVSLLLFPLMFACSLQRDLRLKFLQILYFFLCIITLVDSILKWMTIWDNWWMFWCTICWWRFAMQHFQNLFHKLWSVKKLNCEICTTKFGQPIDQTLINVGKNKNTKIYKPKQQTIISARYTQVQW